jgi:hypothetical protein
MVNLWLSFGLCKNGFITLNEKKTVHCRGRFRARNRSRSEARCFFSSFGLGQGWFLEEALGDDTHDQL